MTDRPYTGLCPKHGPLEVIEEAGLWAAGGTCPTCHALATGPGADAALARLSEPTAREALEAAEEAARGLDASFKMCCAAGLLGSAERERMMLTSARAAIAWLRGWLARRAS